MLCYGGVLYGAVWVWYVSSVCVFGSVTLIRCQHISAGASPLSDPCANRWLAHTIVVQEAERGRDAMTMSKKEVEHVLTTCFGFPEKVREVRNHIQGHERAVDEGMVMNLIQGVRELAHESGHYLEFMYETGQQVCSVCATMVWSTATEAMSLEEATGLVSLFAGDQARARHDGGPLLQAHEACPSRARPVRPEEDPCVQRLQG